MAAGDIWRLSANVLMFDQEQVNVWHFEDTSGATPDAGQSLLNAFEDAALPSYRALFSNQGYVQLVEARQVTGGSAVAQRSYDTSNGIGLRSGSDTLPLQAAAIITWRTGLAGRSRRGRSYLPSTIEGDIGQAGGIGSTYAGLLADFATDLLTMVTPVSLDEWQLHVWSPTLSVATRVTEFVVRPYLGTQRSRRSGT